MQRRLRQARATTAILAVVFAVVLLVAGEWLVAVLLLALAGMLVLRLVLVRDRPLPRRRGGPLPPPDRPRDE